MVYKQEATDWILHYFHRLQQNNFDCMILVSGSKGFGKSTASIYLARRYNELFSYICPYCGRRGYKNFYAMREVNGKKQFYIPDYVTNDKADILCDFEYELDMHTGEKRISTGCGKTFKWSKRKPIPWKAEDYIAYDNPDVVEKVYGLPKYSPLVCVDGKTKVIVREESGLEKEILIETLSKRNCVNYEILSFNQEKRIFEFKKPEGCIKNGGRKDIFTIELDGGGKLVCTSDHLVLTKRGYIKAKDLNDSDEVKIFDEDIGIKNKEIIKKKKSLYEKKRYVQNKVHILRINKKWANNNREKFREYQKKYRKLYPEKYSMKDKIHREKFKGERLEYCKKYYLKRKNVDLDFKNRTSYAKRLSTIMKSSSYVSRDIEKYLGCSIEVYKRHIESTFKKGMSWDNYPSWHAGHIVPLCKFDMSTENGLKDALYFKNVEAIWAEDNFSKGGK